MNKNKQIVSYQGTKCYDELDVDEHLHSFGCNAKYDMRCCSCRQLGCTMPDCVYFHHCRTAYIGIQLAWNRVF